MCKPNEKYQGQNVQGSFASRKFILVALESSPHLIYPNNTAADVNANAITIDSPFATN